MSTVIQGEKIGRYKLIEKIGVGGYSEVWKVKDEFERNYALKIAELSKHQELETEYHKAKDFIHPNLLSPLFYFKEESYACLVLPLCDRSLMDEIKLRKNNEIRNQSQVPLFTELEIASLIRDVADALIYLKKQGVVHKDIKPDNIVIYSQGAKVSYLITDFGISEKHPVSRISRDTIIMEAKNKGITLAYASPEVHNNQVHARSDIYSLGVIICELITGDLLLGTHNKLAGQLRNTEINKLINNLNLPVAQRLVSIILACLKTEPKSRISPDTLLEVSDNFIEKGFWSSLSNDSSYFIKKIAIYSILLFTMVIFYLLYNQNKNELYVKELIRSGEINNAILLCQKNKSVSLFNSNTKLYDFLRKCKSQSWNMKSLSNELILIEDKYKTMSIYNLEGKKIISDSFTFINRITNELFLVELTSNEVFCKDYLIINDQGKIINNVVTNNSVKNTIKSQIFLKTSDNTVSILDCNNKIQKIKI